MIFVANELKEILTPLSKIVSTQEVAENGDKFIFDGNKVYAFNGEIFACDELKTDFKCAVPAELFFKMISKYGMNEIDIEVKEDGLLHVLKGKNDSSFVIENEFECPLSIKKINWEDLPIDFVNAVNVCSYTTGNDYTVVKNVVVHIEGVVVESTDTNRITQFFMEHSMDDEIFIPKTLIKYISQIKPVEYSIQEDWIYFRNSNKVITAFRKTIVEDYYDLQSVVDSHMDGDEIVLPDKIIDALEKAELCLADKFETDRFVSIIIKNKQLTVRADGKAGKHITKMKVDFDSEVKFEINPRSMIEMMINGNTLILNEQSLVMETENAVLMTTLMV